ncbi:MAG: LolA family protein [Candidatus Poribacteria bacterium]
MKMSFWKANILFLSLLLLGCNAIKPKPEVMPTPDVKSILLDLKSRYDLVQTMRTLVNFKMEYKGKSDEVRGYMNYVKPDKLSIYMMGPFNEPRVIASAVGDSLKLYFVNENELIQGQLTDTVMKDIFDIDIRVSDIRSAIFANPFLDGNTDDINIESYGDEYLIKRPSDQKGYTEEISIFAKDIAVNRWRIKDANGKIVQDISFSKYKVIGGIIRPLKATVSRPLDSTTISLESLNPEINVKIDDDVFSLSIPENAKIYQIVDLKNKS